MADAAVAVADLLKDDDVHRAIEGVVRNRVEAVPLAPLAGQALRFATREGRHQEVLDLALAGVRRYIEDHRDDLRARLGKKSKWWIPGAVDDKLFDRVIEGFCKVLAEIEGDRNHELRRDLEPAPGPAGDRAGDVARDAGAGREDQAGPARPARAATVGGRAVVRRQGGAAGAGGRPGVEAAPGRSPRGSSAPVGGCRPTPSWRHGSRRAWKGW